MGFALLRGVRVLDLSQYIPGPYTTRLLADLGAEVLKVEPPGGEPKRRLGSADPDGMTPEYKAINGGKLVIELDLKSAEGRQGFEGLLPLADVLVESYRPGVLARLGFPPQRLRSLNPQLIHCALSGWGQTGPYRDKPGHDVNYMALGGGLIASGTREGPALSFPPVSDYASALQAALTIAAALLARERSSEGRVIDLSLMETVLAWQSTALARVARGRAAPRCGGDLLNGGSASYNIYKTADGRFVSLGIVREEKFWANFCTAVGKPDWIPRLDEPLPQLGLIEEVRALFAGASLAHWESRLGAAETCFQPLVDFAEIPLHPQIQARQLVSKGEGPDAGGDVLYPAWIDGAPPAPRTPLRLVELEALPETWRHR